MGDIDSPTVIPIVLSSNKTHLAGSGKTKAWPLYMTIGNISSKVRWVPSHHCTRLIALFPLMDGTHLQALC
jgi:hypothetical protein